MNWLITGGAGYIGAHIVRDFVNAGHKVYVIDNLERGIRNRLPNDCHFLHGDCSDSNAVSRLLSDFDIQGIIHLAGLKQARESHREPSRYWSNNLLSLLGVIGAIRNSEVRHFIQSSSCSIYGSQSNVSEESAINPLSTYARTKYVSEVILRDVAAELSLSVISLRYFNVIGCGDFPFAFDDSEECIVPSISRKIESGVPVSILGDSFNTKDGTCLRDYLDVRDLSRAHLVASENVSQPKHFQTWNVSSGLPISVLEIATHLISAFQAVNYPIEFIDKNPADPAEIWSNPSEILQSFGWKPKYSLEESLAAHVRSWKTYRSFI